MYYKVVSISYSASKEVLESAVVGDIPFLCVIYAVGKWSKGRHPLMIFDCFDNAAEFARRETKASGTRIYYIYECEADNPRPLDRVVAINWSDLRPSPFNLFWANALGSAWMIKSPEGTLIADRVKLVRPMAKVGTGYCVKMEEDR